MIKYYCWIQSGNFCLFIGSLQHEPAVSLVESCTDVSELPWAAATSSSEAVLPWGCSPFSPHPPQLHPGPFSKEAQKELVTPGLCDKTELLYNSALAPRTSLSCAAQKHTPEAGRAPGALGSWCPDPCRHTL